MHDFHCQKPLICHCISVRQFIAMQWARTVRRIARHQRTHCQHVHGGNTSEDFWGSTSTSSESSDGRNEWISEQVRREVRNLTTAATERDVDRHRAVLSCQRSHNSTTFSRVNQFNHQQQHSSTYTDQQKNIERRLLCSHRPSTRL